MTQLARYLIDAAEAGAVNVLGFCSSRLASYSSIFPLAQDLLAAPASQAFAELVFLCGACLQLGAVTECIDHW